MTQSTEKHHDTCKNVSRQPRILYGCLDLEINRAGQIYDIGALLDGKTFSRHCRGKSSDSLRELDTFLTPAEVLLGHNLLGHDLPALRALQPDLNLLHKPVIDTLYLSPLAFPENPYHRLVKDYKLVRDAVNDPVADARLAAELFADQQEVFSRLLRQEPERLALYRYCFSADDRFQGIADFFAVPDLQINSHKQAAQFFFSLVRNRVCITELAGHLSGWLTEPSTRLALPYCLAWLQVAGGNSVLPPWVLHRFPEVSAIFHALRDVPCPDPACTWCRKTHDPVGQLQRFFGFDSFRPIPACADGSSLQQAVVESGMADRSLLAILPTGGGKSLCYQLPGLVRHMRRGLLTIVISPLQALMKDQVDSLRSRTGTPAAVALYGMLTPPQRGEVLRMVRMGDAGILYVSPEQLRNSSFRAAISQRQIGCWVFDEAHCLSKWGHDFRTDYLYAARFIREFSEEQGGIQQHSIPPVQCFTATAKKDVRDEILHYFRDQLGLQLVLFESTVERENLRFEVQEVGGAGKYSRVLELLDERLEDGAGIVYCATRRNCEQLAAFLEQQGFQAAAFHAGLEAPLKQHIQDAFLDNTIRVICATNAFGMGIDKDNVRLVIHADIPGSLENYLQEAGRAGRDRSEADCVLLFDHQDVETQFAMNSLSRLSRADIAQILRGLRSAKRNPRNNVVLTPHELLRSDRVETSFELEDRDAATKVYTAVSWLERAGFIERNENMTRVFQGRPGVESMEEARRRIADLDLSQVMEQRWLTILEALMNAEPDESFSADQLAELLPPLPDEESGEAGQMVLRTLHEMACAGLVKKTTLLSAFVRYKVRTHSLLLLEKICALERGMLALMQEQAPDADTEQWQSLGLRHLNQGLLDNGFADANPESLRNLLVSLSRDGRGLAGQQGSIDFKQYSRDSYRVRLQRDWQSLRTTARLRENVAFVILNAILACVPDDTPPSGQLLVEFSAEQLLTALRADLILHTELTDPLAAMDRALMFLHEQRVITLQQGLAVFRQAMTIKVHPEKRRYTKGDFEPLSRHYSERIFQVHVMNEYARRGAEKIAQALKLVLGYFTMDRSDFIRRFFPGREDILGRATSHESFVQIVDALRNPEQQSLVSAEKNRNLLILAGPGAGKTRVVVHRCAYLLRVRRVPASSILVLCFNRSGVSSIRGRLRQLVDRDSIGVAIYTYHGLALRLTGHSLLSMEQKEGEPNFSSCLQTATQLLRGEREIPGLEEDEYRERLLSGWRYILVDEYQDIDREQYELIAALSGRTLEANAHRLTIMAVGDDDQNIYSFRGSSIEFIRRFRDDYQAEVRYLVENYRSSGHIIAAANQLISQNRERMKTDHPVRVDRARQQVDPGGRWYLLDPFAQGRVHCIEVEGDTAQAGAVLAALERLRACDPDWKWQDFAILAREWTALSGVRALFEQQQFEIPLDMVMDINTQPPLHRIREFALFIDRLKEMTAELCTAADLITLADQLRSGRNNRWWRRLSRLLDDWQQEAGDGELPVSMFLEYLFEVLREQRRERLGDDAVFLGTVHAAKGLEFGHVVILDNGWQRAVRKGSLQEERRLYYVGMTRARETLTLLQNRSEPNPFTPKLSGDFLLRTSYEQTGQSDFQPTRYTMLGLQDIDLGYAGRKSADNPVHDVLATLEPGSPLTLRKQKNRLLLLSDNYPVAALSRTGSDYWFDKTEKIVSIRVVAIIRRSAEDGDPTYQHCYHTQQWEIPLVEIACKG